MLQFITWVSKHYSLIALKLECETGPKKNLWMHDKSIPFWVRAVKYLGLISRVLQIFLLRSMFEEHDHFAWAFCKMRSKSAPTAFTISECCSRFWYILCHAPVERCMAISLPPLSLFLFVPTAKFYSLEQSEMTVRANQKKDCDVYGTVLVIPLPWC